MRAYLRLLCVASLRLLVEGLVCIGLTTVVGLVDSSPNPRAHRFNTMWQFKVSDFLFMCTFIGRNLHDYRHHSYLPLASASTPLGPVTRRASCRILQPATKPWQ